VSRGAKDHELQHGVLDRPFRYISCGSSHSTDSAVPYPKYSTCFDVSLGKPPSGLRLFDSSASRARPLVSSSPVCCGGAVSVEALRVACGDETKVSGGPGARANVCDSDVSIFPSKPISISARHMARVVRRAIV
jgi:hypothetical protein